MISMDYHKEKFAFSTGEKREVFSHLTWLVVWCQSICTICPVSIFATNFSPHQGLRREVYLFFLSMAPRVSMSEMLSNNWLAAACMSTEFLDSREISGARSVSRWAKPWFWRNQEWSTWVTEVGGRVMLIGAWTISFLLHLHHSCRI